MRYIQQQRLDIVSSKSKLKNVIHANITGLDMHCFSTLSLFWLFFGEFQNPKGRSAMLPLTSTSFATSTSTTTTTSTLTSTMIYYIVREIYYYS